MRGRSALPASALLVLGALYTAPLFAAPNAAEKAAAEALFQDGVALLQASKADAACAKFAASEELDPALGTMLRLADCYDRTGKTASAWALFEEAASVAQARGERARETAARERVADIGKRLTKIKVQVAGSTLSTLVIKLNGTAIPRASWDSEIPVDSGDQVIESSAPGFNTWTGHVTAPPGPATTGIEIPQLVPAPQAPVSPSSAPSRDSRPPPPAADSWQTQRTVAYLAGGVGVVSLAVAGVTAYLAAARNHDSLTQCKPNAPNLCTQPGLDSRNQALSLAKVSTVTSIVGGALVAGGVTLLLIKPSGQSQHTGSASVRVLASALPGSADLGMVASW